MSAISEAIDRLAIWAEKRNAMSCLRGWMICSGYDPTFGADPKITTKDLTPDQIKKLESAAGGCPPRLSVEQIEEIIKHYPFRLPIEIYELYQRGNGCLPIGLGKDKDWNSFDNYFIFPNMDEPFCPLEGAMELYRHLVEYREKYNKNIDPRLFPISIFEERTHAVMGSEEQQETSPVYIFYTDSFKPRMKWPSLTNTILAETEIRERSLQQTVESGRKEIEAIWCKYGKVY